MTSVPFLLAPVAYAVGAIPASYWIGRVFYKKDLSKLGSGNLGATNAFRVLGWRAALPVVVVDVFKGFGPAWWFPQLDGRDAVSWAVLYGGIAIVGHVLSFWVGFRGGKGVATSAGVLAALAPAALAAGFGVWVLTALGTRIVSLASIAAVLAVPIAAWLLPGTEPVLQGFLLSLALFVVWAHRSNIRRLLEGREPRMGGWGRRAGKRRVGQETREVDLGDRRAFRASDREAERGRRE